MWLLALVLACPLERGASHPRFGGEPYRRADGGVTAIEVYFAKTANDPDSVDVTDCTDPWVDEKRGWVTVCTVRAKNGFGAVVAQQWEFTMQQGQVITENRVP